MATKKAAKAATPAPPAEAPPAPRVFGNYRCPLEDVKFRGRPCNKWMYAGTGPRTLRCKRCGRTTSFEGPTEVIR